MVKKVFHGRKSFPNGPMMAQVSFALEALSLSPKDLQGSAPAISTHPSPLVARKTGQFPFDGSQKRFQRVLLSEMSIRSKEVIRSAHAKPAVLAVLAHF